MVSSEFGVMSNSNIVCRQGASGWPGASTGRTSLSKSGRSVYAAGMKSGGRDLWCGTYKLGQLLLYGHYN